MYIIRSTGTSLCKIYLTEEADPTPPFKAHRHKERNFSTLENSLLPTLPTLHYYLFLAAAVSRRLGCTCM